MPRGTHSVAGDECHGTSHSADAWPCRGWIWSCISNPGLGGHPSCPLGARALPGAWHRPRLRGDGPSCHQHVAPAPGEAQYMPTAAQKSPRCPGVVASEWGSGGHSRAVSGLCSPSLASLLGEMGWRLQELQVRWQTQPCHLAGWGCWSGGDVDRICPETPA